MNPQELTNEQRRQLIDAGQLFKAWHDADRQFRQSYRGTMRWQRSKGREYLYRYTYEGPSRTGQSLGLRSAETEKLKADYMEARARLRQRVSRSAARLKAMAPVNRALRLNRLPKTETAILRALDRAGLLGNQLFVVGTNALYAYEMKAGVLLTSDLLATGDMDLLWDVRRLSLVAADAKDQGVIGVLRSVDDSFKPVAKRSFRAENDDGYLVDLIRPEVVDQRRPGPEKIGTADDDLYGVGIEGLKWLVNVPRMDETVIGSDGIPLTMPCIDPRAFALHKLWLSRRADRNARQRPRDEAHAVAVAAICMSHLNLKLDAKELSALPAELRGLADELKKMADEWATQAQTTNDP